jgi:hypothetical protein
MVGLAELWLPILVSAVAVFIASAIIWMALKYHDKDIQTMPQESEFLDAIRPMNIKAGLYMFPGCHGVDLKSEPYLSNWKNGPWGIITIAGKQPNFGLNLLRCFISYLVISALVGYLTGIGMAPGAEYMDVFRVAATAALLGHCFGGLANDFFLGKPTRFIITGLIDGVVFALITAGIFAAMWPGAPTA